VFIYVYLLLAWLVPAIGGFFLDRKIKSGLMLVANELNCFGGDSLGIYNTKLLPLPNTGKKLTTTAKYNA